MSVTWDESKHPRDKIGRWTAAGGEASGDQAQSPDEYSDEDQAKHRAAMSKIAAARDTINDAAEQIKAKMAELAQLQKTLEKQVAAIEAAHEKVAEIADEYGLDYETADDDFNSAASDLASEIENTLDSLKESHKQLKKHA
ncbi:hypothetical protein [Pseudorhodoplanes sp.]|uniref:hypothetical protein n=1 Tax=Pseudorhodoplanes sp. TaxID=1934341 RepID=UPI002CDD5F25|nr:hypothetical protein [Pseudorhodoplanes sp.]HWV44120.1 hypothetical protein [Pseudorhodoplanes sp.]